MAAQPTPAHPATMVAELTTAPSSATNTDTPLPEPLFRTKRLLARPMCPQDAPSTQRACAPASITKYMTLAFAHPYTLEHAKAWIEMNRSTPNDKLVLTTHSDPYTVIGGIGIKPGTDVQSHTGEVGYWVAEEAWGQGLTTEALEGFMEWTFLVRDGDGSPEVEGKPKEVRKTKLFAGVFSGNVASMRCLEKCGFKEEGVQKGQIEKHGVVSDLHLFGLTKGDWEAWRQEQGR